MSTILARTTSRYGNVYLRARASSSRRCSADNRTTYGLLLGIGIPSEGTPYVTEHPHLRDRSYVIVFMEERTKPATASGWPRLTGVGRGRRVRCPRSAWRVRGGVGGAAGRPSGRDRSWP